MSLFKGPVEELPHVSVDNFEMESNGSSTCFFLSHCHTDHMKGLRSWPFLQFIKNHKQFYLYCSSISKLILQSFSELNQINDQIKDLGIGLSSVRVPSLNDKDISYDLTVSCIPAGHCPGSVMFLFETPQHTILYTGDFRIATGDVSKFKQLHDGPNVKRIDKIYLDATFFNDCYWKFPKRAFSISMIIEKTRDWLNASRQNFVCLDMTANYGGEHIMKCVAKALKSKIHVHQEIYNLYSRVPEERENLTDRCETTRIHAKIRKQNLNCFHQRLDEHTLIIKPKAAPFESTEHKSPAAAAIKNKNIIEVNYSSHSSYTEIIDFLTYLKPRDVEICTDIFKSSLSEGKERIKKLLLSCKEEETTEPALKRTRCMDNPVPYEPIHLVISTVENSQDTDLDSPE